MADEKKKCQGKSHIRWEIYGGAIETKDSQQRALITSVQGL